MQTPSTIAESVSRWTALGITFDKPLAQAISLYEMVKYLELEHQPIVSLDGLTAKNAEDRINDLARQLAVSAAHSGGPRSPLQAAKAKYVEASARAVNQLAIQAIPDAVEQLTPGFVEHADAYVGAVARLPEELTSDTLVAAGAGAVEALGVAQQEAAHLREIDTWIASTAFLSGTAPTEVVLRLLRPTSALELVKLDAAREKPANPMVRDLNPVWLAAARLGVEFSINTPREAVELRRSLQAVPERSLSRAG